MSGYRIRIAGYRLNKAGELVPDVRRLSVSQRLRHAGSKRARGVARRHNQVSKSR